MVRDVFVSHASDDSALAVQVCELLEQRGLAGWVAPRGTAVPLSLIQNWNPDAGK